MKLSKQQFAALVSDTPRHTAPYNKLFLSPTYLARPAKGTAQIGLEELAASIKASGLLENLIVVERARTLSCLWWRAALADDGTVGPRGRLAGKPSGDQSPAWLAYRERRSYRCGRGRGSKPGPVSRPYRSRSHLDAADGRHC